MREKVDFLQADKHESFQQVNGVTLGVDIQACAKDPK